MDTHYIIAVIVTYSILFIVFVVASLVDHKAQITRDRIEDQICRLNLGKKYYEELYGRGSWNTIK